MNPEGTINSGLWEAVSKDYETGNFSAAILNAVQFLGDLIREKTGLESDGVALVGNAFGGKSPLLKVTRLQTDSDKNVQAGVEQILRGIYQAIRNPRSHRKHCDQQKDADAIIIFIDYLLSIIDQSKAPFIKEEFVRRVLDKNFVKNQRYADLLAREIPAKQRLDVMFEILGRRKEGDAEALGIFVHILLKKLVAVERKEVVKALSEELKTSDDVIATRLITQILPLQFYRQLEEAARLRTENRFLNSIKQGRYDIVARHCVEGAFGSWANKIAPTFVLKEEVSTTLLKKLSSPDHSEQDYVIQFFWYTLQKLCPSTSPDLLAALSTGLKTGNRRLYEKLSRAPESLRKALQDDLDSFQETPPGITDNDIPF